MAIQHPPAPVRVVSTRVEGEALEGIGYRLIGGKLERGRWDLVLRFEPTTPDDWSAEDILRREA